MPKIIDQDGKRLSWIAHYNRYMHPYEVSCESFDQAIGILFWGRDNGELSPQKIVCPNGDIINGEALIKALGDYGEEHGG